MPVILIGPGHMYAIPLARRDRRFKLSIVPVMDLRLASPCHVHYTLVGRVDSWMNSVTAVVSDRVGIPSQLTSVVLGLIMKFRPGLDGIVPELALTHVCSARQSPFLQAFRTMPPQQNRFQVPNVQFRVLIIGRANAGKTTILQRVCNTTEGPKVYRRDPQGQRSEVRTRSWLHPSVSSPS